MRLLIAYDGSECSDALLADLPRAGLPNDVEAVVVSVAETWLPPPAAAMLAAPVIPDERDEERRASDLAAAGCRLVSRLFPDWDVRGAEYVGSPANQILEHCEEFGPDLIVVGSHGLSALERMLMGSVSQKLVTESHCSVRVARWPRRVEGPVRILVAVDDTFFAAEAVTEVGRRAWPAGSVVELFTAYDAHVKSGVDLDKELSRIDQLHLSYVADLRGTDLRVERHVAQGNPKRLIPERAVTFGADCILLGARGHGRLERLMLGSVAAAVAARADCSVEVVRRRN
jgi:nucleotide-binding universal stress UspA family protein